MNYSNNYKTLAISNLKGFTLIELLVVVIIIGTLSAIALPSYLNQVAKARGSEAKSDLGSINRSQQSYRWEKGQFASQLTNLDIRVNSKFYDYSIPSSNTTDTLTITTSKKDELKVSSAAVTQNSDLFTQIICESGDTQSINTSAIQPTGGNGTTLDCPASYNTVH
jgi:type IV pilus assembly protein PilA